MRSKRTRPHGSARLPHLGLSNCPMNAHAPRAYESAPRRHRCRVRPLVHAGGRPDDRGRLDLDGRRPAFTELIVLMSPRPDSRYGCRTQLLMHPDQAEVLSAELPQPCPLRPKSSTGPGPDQRLVLPRPSARAHRTSSRRCAAPADPAVAATVSATDLGRVQAAHLIADLGARAQVVIRWVGGSLYLLPLHATVRTLSWLPSRITNLDRYARTVDARPLTPRSVVDVAVRGLQILASVHRFTVLGAWALLQLRTKRLPMR